MNQSINEMVVNGQTYVLKGSENVPATKVDGMEYVVIRTYSAGVHTGYLESRAGKDVCLRKSRRIWYWDGAASLSQMAVDGVSNPDGCKFSVEVDKIELTEAVEVLYCTEKAKTNICGVKVWKK